MSTQQGFNIFIIATISVLLFISILIFVLLIIRVYQKWSDDKKISVSIKLVIVMSIFICSCCIMYLFSTLSSKRILSVIAFVVYWLSKLVQILILIHEEFKRKLMLTLYLYLIL